MRYSKYLGVVEGEGNFVVQCLHCGQALCSAGDNWREHVLVCDRNPAEVFPFETESRAPKAEDCIYREFYCPNCAMMFDVEPVPVEHIHEPLRQDVKLKRFERTAG